MFYPNAYLLDYICFVGALTLFNAIRMSVQYVSWLYKVNQWRDWHKSRVTSVDDGVIYE